MTPLIDVVVVSWNGREDTLTLLRSLAPELRTTQGRVRVTVVDNGSVDGTIDAVRREHPAVRVLRLERNRGFTGGVAAGAGSATAPWLALVNNDAAAEEGWIDAMLGAASRAASDVISFAGRIVSFDGTRVDFHRGRMTFDGHAFQQDFGAPIAAVDIADEGTEMLFACGGNMLVRREAFNELGGFDDDYFAYLEDVDFGWRSWISGWRTEWLPSASIRHKSSATSNRLGDFERGVLFERNAAQTMIKNVEDTHAAAAMSQTWLAMLHRQHEYLVTRNPSSDPLRRAPFGTEGRSERADWRTRLTRLLWRDPDAVVIRDPLARMQMRAIHWIFDNRDLLMTKRARVQAGRKRTDEEIFARFPVVETPTYPGDEALMSSQLFRFVTGPWQRERRSLDEMMHRA